MSDDEAREFAEELVDNLRIAATVGERDANDDGTRVSLEELTTGVSEREAAIREAWEYVTTVSPGRARLISALLAELDAARELLAWYVAQHGLNSYAADGRCKCPHCKTARPLLGEGA